MANLSGDMLSQLQGLGYGQTKTINGLSYSPMGIMSTDEGGQNFTLQGYAAYDPNSAINSPGTSYQYYDPSGNFVGNRQTLNSGFNPSDFKDLGQAVGLLGGMYLGGQGLAAMGAGSAGGIAGSGIGAGTAGTAGVTGLPSGAAADMFYGGGLDGAATVGGGASLGGTAGALGTTGAAAGAASGVGGGVSIPSGTGGLASAISSILGGNNGSSSSGGLNLGNLSTLLGGALDYHNQNAAAQNMIDYLKQRQSVNDQMYAPGSPEYNYLWDQMSRQDAAAGRNSQYGPRSVDLAARIAQMKMNANTSMTTGIGNMMANAYNRQAAAPAGLSSALGALGQGGLGNLSLSQILQQLQGLNLNPSGAVPNDIPVGDGTMDNIDVGGGYNPA